MLLSTSLVECVGNTVIYMFMFFVLYKILDYLRRLPYIRNYQDKYILVTGCDTGFGNAISKQLDSKGCHVFAGCLTERGETELKKCCSSRLVTVSLDVTKHDSVLKAYDVISEKIPKNKGLWGVINNAGIIGNSAAPFEWLTTDDYRKVFSVNVHGLVDVTTTFIPLIKKARGRIVNTASIFGRTSLNGSAPYSMSKYCVESFSDSIRKQLMHWGVSVHLIEPGFHKTNITSVENIQGALRRAYAQAGETARREYGDDFIKKSEEVIVKQFLSGIMTEDISGVVNAYEHALLARAPRARYVVGNDAKYLWLPAHQLPERVGDRLIDLLAGRDKPVPAALRK